MSWTCPASSRTWCLTPWTRRPAVRRRCGCLIAVARSIPRGSQRSRVIGYVCYADRFAGSLPGLRRQLDYLTELGITYLHLMPLLKPRDGASDGGYAVRITSSRRSATWAPWTISGARRRPARAGHRAVHRPGPQPHRARARMGPQALAGDPDYREMYLIYPDRTEPDAYERTLPEVFPDSRPATSPRCRSWAGSGRPSTLASGISTTPTRPSSRPCWA